jgi:hypothetical protein
VRGQPRYGSFEQLFVLLVDQARFRRTNFGFAHLCALQGLHILSPNNGGGAVPVEPVKCGSAHDREYPGARISVGETIDSM